MRFVLGPLLAAICLTASTASAEEGPFIGFQAGWSLPSDISLHSKDAATPLQGHIATRGAAEVAGELGYNLPDGISVSAEITHAEYGVASTTINGTQNFVTTGSVAESAILGDVTYQIPYRDRISWVVGAGAGPAQISPNFTDAANARTSGNGTTLAWQLLAGANWVLDPVLRLQLDYRFRSVLGTNHTYGKTAVDFGSLSSHSLMLSVRWLLVAPG